MPDSKHHDTTRDNSKTRDNSNDVTDVTDEQRSETGTKKRPGLMRILQRSRNQLAELTGMTVESVSSFQRSDDGWTLEVEVLELSRVPDTMSLLGSYEVQVDEDGELIGYRRVRRYERGRADPQQRG